MPSLFYAVLLLILFFALFPFFIPRYIICHQGLGYTYFPANTETLISEISEKTFPTSETSCFF